MFRNGPSTNIGIPAAMRYLTNSVEPSLFPNGKLGTKRALTGNDDIWFGNSTEERKVLIQNARNQSTISLDVEGFELHQNEAVLNCQARKLHR